MDYIKRIFITLLIMLGLIANESSILASKANLNENELNSISCVLIDGESGRILYGKNEFEKRPMASTTKIMTLILALEYGNLNDTVTFSPNAASMPEVSLGACSNEQFMLRDLLYSLMLESHNDSAVAIAEHIGGSVEGFSSLMNEKAKQLGLSDTYFITPNGLDAKNENGRHETTASDLALLMRYCCFVSEKKEEFISICQTREYSINEISKNKVYNLNNKNSFLDMMDGVIAGKTGFTGEAGYCYVCAYEKEGKKYIVALLGCGWPNNKSYKWKDSQKLLEYGYDNFYNENLDSFYLPELDVNNSVENQKLQLCVDYIKKTQLASFEKIRYELVISKELNAPIYKGQIMGEIKIYIDDEYYQNYIVYAKNNVYEINYKYYFKIMIDKILRNNN